MVVVSGQLPKARLSTEDLCWLCVFSEGHCPSEDLLLTIVVFKGKKILYFQLETESR